MPDTVDQYEGLIIRKSISCLVGPATESSNVLDLPQVIAEASSRLGDIGVVVRWVVMSDAQLVRAVAAESSLTAGDDPLLIATFLEHSDGAAYVASVAELLLAVRLLLVAEGAPALSLAVTETAAGIVRSAVGHPTDATLVGLLGLGFCSPGTPKAPAPNTATLAHGSWEPAAPLPPAYLPGPPLPAIERFRTLGICESCVPLGQCRLGLVSHIDPDGRVRGTVTIPEAFSGSPGYAHGGFVATVFDDILSRVAGHGVIAAMTGTLTIRYRLPVPTRTSLAVSGVITGVETRKRSVHAEIRASDTGQILAEADGIFIEVTEVPALPGT